MLEERVFKRVRVAILHMQKTNNVEIIGNAASRECACEEHDLTEEEDGVAGNWGIAEEKTEAKVCS